MNNYESVAGVMHSTVSLTSSQTLYIPTYRNVLIHGFPSLEEGGGNNSQTSQCSNMHYIDHIQALFAICVCRVTTEHLYRIHHHQ